MLDLAEHLLKQTLDVLRPLIRAGTPLVGLEPSCVAVFRDEMVNLLPHDEDARRLYKQSFLLSEFLVQQAPDYKLPTLRRKALVHGHCHHKSLMKMNDEMKILSGLGLDIDAPETGCCGMAGAFGFEKEHYDVSIKCGERVLLPAVRAAARDTLVIADGFSCREQIAQSTDRQALHLAQVLQMALREQATGSASDYPERDYITAPPRGLEGAERMAALTGAGVAVGGAVLYATRRLKKGRNT